MFAFVWFSALFIVCSSSLYQCVKTSYISLCDHLTINYLSNKRREKETKGKDGRRERSERKKMDGEKKQKERKAKKEERNGRTMEGKKHKKERNLKKQNETNENRFRCRFDFLCMPGLKTDSKETGDWHKKKKKQTNKIRHTNSSYSINNT